MAKPVKHADTDTLLLRTLLGVAGALAKPRPLQENVHEALSDVADALGLDRVSLRVPQENGIFELVAEATPTPGAWPGAQLSDPDSAVARAFETRTPFVENRRALPKRGGNQQGNPGVASAAAFPITYGDQCVGVLYCGSLTEGFFGEERVTFLTAVANGCGAHLHNARLREAMERQLRLASDRSNFIEIASHELRTPISVLTGYTELMIDSGSFNGRELQWLSEAHQEANRLGRIVDDLVTLEWLRSGEAPRSVDEFSLHLLLRMVKEAADNDWPDASMTLQASEGIILGDLLRLLKVISAVVDNSFRHGKATSVELAAELDDASQMCTIAVSDDGEGFPEGFDSTAIGLFARPDYEHRSNVRGLGLGLFMVKTFLEAVAGDFSIDSGPDGATVKVTFPATMISETSAAH